MSTSLLQLKATSSAKETAERTAEERRRNILVLMIDYLGRNGYVESCQRLQGESGVTQAKWEIADNMDLSTVLVQFEEYYEMKFAKKPVVARAVKAAADPKKEKRSTSTLPSVPGATQGPPASAPPNSTIPSASSLANTYGGTIANFLNSAGTAPVSVTSASVPVAAAGSTASNSNLNSTSAGQSSSAKLKRGSSKGDDLSEVAITGVNVAIVAANSAAAAAERAAAEKQKSAQDFDFHVNRLLKPLPMYADNAEFREMASMITRDIYQENPNVHWSDIAELEEPKQLLQEAIVLPVKYPQLFSGLLAPWKGVLLYGPPGTGKTMLARAVATECRTTFFNISASSIVSKWRGDSEKLVRVLFELARYHAPSTIFLDEIDSIMTSRDSGGGSGSGGGEHEGSRRMKTELLIQMDGLAKTSDFVFVMAASNLPWELDTAMLRRLEKRILVPLPTATARESIVRKLLPPERTLELNYAEIAGKTQNFSGADIELLCKEAAMRPVRRILRRLTASPDLDLAGEQLMLPPVTVRDIAAALAVTRPATSAEQAARFTKYHEQFGSGVATTTEDAEDEEEEKALVEYYQKQHVQLVQQQHQQQLEQQQLLEQMQNVPPRRRVDVAPSRIPANVREQLTQSIPSGHVDAHLASGTSSRSGSNPASRRPSGTSSKAPL